eukprot:comp8993_c0_seq1/m.4197 comp8993_c0_seq1/g.4197  ORF comp8993_c0_seq1/g.4197 comp8993_c0_seq1/m.4197 type:complete len:199 (-) comp8993_c0_seq1:18-614(-)
MPPKGMKVVCDGDTCRLVPDDSEEAADTQHETTSKGEKGAASGDLPAVAKKEGFTRLVNTDGKEVPLSVLEGKFVGLYFSAAWCGPCQVFSPKLSEFASKHSSDFVVLFVSMDKTEKDMFDYVRGKNFYVIPFDEATRLDLPSAHSVMAIPTLEIINPEGNTITTWGRGAVEKNPDTCLEEWKRGGHGVGWLDYLRLW